MFILSDLNGQPYSALNERCTDDLWKLSMPQIDDLMNRRDVRPPAGWEGNNGNSGTTTTAQPAQTHVAK